jgi:cysteine synthase
MQYENYSNLQTHYLYTGQEIWEDFKEKLDVCVMAVGTCGTISGVGKALKEKNVNIKIYGVEPEGSIIFGGKPGQYYIQGGGLSFIPKILNRNFIDKGFKVSDFNAIKTAKELAEKEGVMVGGTGALVAHICINLAKELGANKNIVGVIPDAGDRYLDTIYNNEWCLYHKFIFKKNKLPTEELTNILEKEGCTLNEF